MKFRIKKKQNWAPNRADEIINALSNIVIGENNTAFSIVDDSNMHLGSKALSKPEISEVNLYSKFKIIIILIAISTPCYALDVSPIAFMASYHTRATTAAGKPYNDFNPGVGIDITQGSKWRYGAILADYKNSISKNSVVAVGKLDYCFEDGIRICPGMVAGLVTGYGSTVTPMAAPTLELGYGKFSVVGTVLPAQDFKAVSLTGWLKYKLFTW